MSTAALALGMETADTGSGGGDSGGFAATFAHTERVIIVGGGQAGRRLAEQLAQDKPVHHVDDSTTAVANPRGYEASHARDLTSVPALAAAGFTTESVAVVMTHTDARTLLVTQLVRTHFGVERVCAVLNDPRNRDAFDIDGVTVVCGAAVLADAVLAETVDVVLLTTPATEREAKTADADRLERG